jgi:hypothetical protein
MFKSDKSFTVCEVMTIFAKAGNRDTVLWLIGLDAPIIKKCISNPFQNVIFLF